MDKKFDIDLKSLSPQQLASLISQANDILEEKKQEELDKIKQEMSGKLSQLGLSLEDLIPQKSNAKKTKASNPNLEVPVKGATYRNPLNPDESWTAGEKKGRAPAWVTDLREKGELHKHKLT